MKKKLASLKSEFNNITTIQANLSESTQIEELVKTTIKEKEKIDVLICNAGITKDNLIIRMSEEDFSNVLQVNLTSSFLLSKLVLKQMMRKKQGKIIGISSVVASMGNMGQANYIASKSGLEGMYRVFALEAAARGINVNCIAPGFIETEMTKKIPEDLQNKMKERIALGSFGKPETVADACLFLSSDMASYITGQVLHVNGGMYLN